MTYSNHRKIGIPDYATLRIGPFYSMMTFSQSVGCRYTDSQSAGVDFLYENQRGVMKTNGLEFPLVSTLDLRNYLVLSDNADMDLSLSASYSHYPLETQENNFIFDLVQEGAIGNISMEFTPTPFIKGTVYNNAVYGTEYVDTRGILDRYGGARYEHFNNTIGAKTDWLMAKGRNMGLSVQRTDVIPMGGTFEDQQESSYAEALWYEQEVNPYVVAGLRGNFSQTTYPSTNRSGNTASQVYSLYADMRLTRQTTAKASIGYSMASASSQDSGVEDDPGLIVGEVSMTTELSPEIAHSLEYSNSREGGFNSDFEVVDTYRYQIDWHGKLTKAGLYSSLVSVAPDSTSVSGYDDLSSGINLSYPVVPYITVALSSVYDVRMNDVTGASSSTETEWNYDYDTWTSQIGTTFSLTREVTFSTAIQHIERTSDSAELTYQMNIFTADFTYKHDF